MKKIFFVLGLLLIFSVFAPQRDVRSEDFYHGKTIRLVVGTSPGGAMDDWARFLAPHLSRNIPGAPDIVVQNMPGAGTTIAANHIYRIANPDGLTIGLVNPSIYMDQLLGAKEVRFDWPKFSWIGSPERVDQVLFMLADTPYKSIDEMRKLPSRPGVRLSRAPGWDIFYPSSSRKPSEPRFIWCSVTAAVAI
jgi:tripartite-type tricarboxylate transporter receptor subunit TctC